MTLANGYVSLLRTIKDSLANYLEVQSGIKFNGLDQPDTTLTGYVNIYQIEPKDQDTSTKIHNPFARNLENKLEIEIKLSIKGSDYDLMDNLLLDQMEYFSGLIENELCENGIIINHPKWKTPTGLKGSRVKIVRKEIRQITTGNQEDNADNLYDGFVSLMIVTED